MAFNTIREIGWDKQKGLKGNVVNVPIDIPKIFSELPRNLNPNEIIELNFKRHKDYERNYIAETVCRPAVLFDSMKVLIKSPLFKKLKISDQMTKWLKENNNNINESENAKNVLSGIKTMSLDDIDNDCSNDENETEKLKTEKQEESERRQDEDNHNIIFGQTMINNDFDQIILDQLNEPISITMAPGQYKTPVPICFDELAEASTFIKIWGGNLIKKDLDLSFLNRCKSYLRNTDRRIATNIPYIFWLYRYMMAKRLLQAITTNLRRHKLKDQNITAGVMLNHKDKLKKLYLDDDLNKFMSSIRSSPLFWSLKRKEAFAMIRQFGISQLFFSFSPSERDSAALILMLEKFLNNNNTYTLEEAEMLIAESYNNENPRIRDAAKAKICDLISRDPVTVARWNENRLALIRSYIIHPNGPFRKNPIKDYIFRTEFQNRGTPHYHGTAWVETPAIYKTKNDLPNCVDFIDSYITCEWHDNFKTIVVSDSSSDEEVRQENNLKKKKLQKNHFERSCDHNCESESDEENEIKDNLSYEKIFPSISKIEERQKRRKQKENDRYALKRLVKFQYHKHMTNCIVKIDSEDPKSKHTCKQGFPFPLFDESVILFPLNCDKKKRRNEDALDEGRWKTIEEKMDYIEECKAIHIRIKQWLDITVYNQLKRLRNNEPFDTKVTMEEFLDTMKLTKEKYIDALRTAIRKPSVFYKRTSHDIMVNPYNKDILARHKSNMDIQFVINSYALISYITAYMMKSNAKISKLLQTAIDEVKTKKNLSHKQKLQAIANKWQNGSEISAQECVYHLLSMPLVHSSRSVVFILTFSMNQRYQMIKSREMLRDLNANSTDIFIDGLIDHYIHRPPSFENMSLIIFAAWFNYFSNSQYEKIENIQSKNKSAKGKRIAKKIKNYLQENRDDDEYEEMLNEEFLNGEEQRIGEFFMLQAKKGWIQRRERSRLVRYRGFDKNKAKEKRDYFREQMMLFYPFRDEKKEIEDHANMESVYSSRIHTIAENQNEFENIFGYSTTEIQLNKIAEDLDEIRENRIEEQFDEFLEAEAILEADEDDLDETQLRIREDLEAEHGFFGRIEMDDPYTKGVEQKTENYSFNPKILPDNIYYKDLSSLNIDQHRYILTVIKKLSNNQTFYHLITGAGGCGKSYVIKLINQATLRMIDKISANKQDAGVQRPTYVLMSSFLGKVAFRMRGSTIHSAFSLRLGDFVDTGNYELMRKRFGVDSDEKTCALQLIIFDEASLIGKHLFNLIDAKLRGMLNKPNEKFGGIPIILSGDFNQNKPIMTGGFLFEPDESGYKVLYNNNEINELWEPFELFELTQIMRQREDKEFSQALTYFGNTGFVDLPQQYLDIFNECIRPKNEIPEGALYLFATNINRKIMNDEKITEPFFTQAAHDLVYGGEDEDANARLYNRHIQTLLNLDDEDKHWMPNEIKIKIGTRYILLFNEDVPDGLANGTVGILRNYVFDRKCPEKIEILFLDFLEDDVGLDRRNNFSITQNILNRLVEPMSKNDLKALTPIKRSVAKINIAPTRFDWCFHRIQFQLVPCEAMTISKIQGDTCDKIALDISQRMADMRSNYYVAMSRVTKKQNLYLYGADCLIGTKNIGTGYGVDRHTAIKSMSSIKQKKAREYFLNNNPVQLEMARLRRDRRVCLDFEKIFSTNESNKSNISIMFYNIDMNYKKKFNVIKNDYGLMNSDILIFTNCSLNMSDASIHDNSFNIDGFQLIKSSGPDEPKFGNFLYVKKDKMQNIKFKVLRSNDGRGSNIEIEITLFKFSFQNVKFYITYAQNNKCESMQQFYEYIKTFLTNSLIEKHLSEPELKHQMFIFISFNGELQFTKDELKVIPQKLSKKWNFFHLFDPMYSDDNKHPVWCMTNSRFGNIKENKNVNQFMDFETYFSLISRFHPKWINFKNA